VALALAVVLLMLVLAVPYDPVSFAAVEAMWDTFNNVADGFGINCQVLDRLLARFSS
jgi:hypothetical protein